MNEFAKILLPMIRKVVPGVIAQDIIGVQPMMDPNVFTIGEGLRSGEKYFYWARPPVNIGQVFSYGSPLENDCYRWCHETFGEINDTSPWFYLESKYYFAREEDRTMFVLKWQA